MEHSGNHSLINSFHTVIGKKKIFISKKVTYISTTRINRYIDEPGNSDNHPAVAAMDVPARINHLFNYSDFSDHRHNRSIHHSKIPPSTYQVFNIPDPVIRITDESKGRCGQ